MSTEIDAALGAPRAVPSADGSANRGLINSAAAAITQRFHIREVVAQDLDCVRTWLPGSLKVPATRLSVATDAATGRVAGLAALLAFRDGGGRFWLGVSPGFRRCGCGTALLEGVHQTARQAKLTTLITHVSYRTAADEANRDILEFYKARGLSVVQEVVRYRGELKTAEEVMGPLYRRYEQRPGKSERAHIVPATQVDPTAVAAFAIRHLGGLLDEVAARLNGRGVAYDRVSSMVALVDKTIVGAFLTIVHGSEVFIETRIAEAAHRGGWVNLALMYRATAAALANGVKNIEFEHDVLEPDTAKLAKRLGAIEIGRRRCWGCSLAEDDKVTGWQGDKVTQESGDVTLSPPHPVTLSSSTGWQAEALGAPLVDGMRTEQLQERLLFDSVNDVIQVLTERGIGDMSATNHNRGVTLQVKLVRSGPALFDRNSGLKACLLFNALPYSASTYVFDRLTAGLALDVVHIGTSELFQAGIDPRLGVRLAVPGTLCHGHADARVGNLVFIHRFLERIVVHVRDPRQAMLAAVHDLNDLRRRQEMSRLPSLGLPLPAHYFDLSLPEQIDYFIGTGLPQFVRWLESWLEAVATPLFRTRVLFTRYDDLCADPAAFLQSIREFYGVAWKSPDFLAHAGLSAFRQETAQDWRSVLTPGQRQAVDAQVPPQLLARFGWSDR